MSLHEGAFLLVVFLSNVIQCITGFAGTVLAMPPSVMLVGLDTARPILNLMGVAASVGVAIPGRRHIDKKEWLTMLGVSLPGMALGAFLKHWFASYQSALFKTLGVVVIVIAVTKLVCFLAKKEIPLDNRAVALSFLAVGGVVHGMFVCGGPLIVTYADARLKDKDAFRATLSAVWCVLNPVLLVADFIVGGVPVELWKLTLLSLAALFFAILAGNALAKKLSRKVFLLLTYALMLVSGVSLFLK